MAKPKTKLPNVWMRNVELFLEEPVPYDPEASWTPDVLKSVARAYLALRAENEGLKRSTRRRRDEIIEVQDERNDIRAELAAAREEIAENGALCVKLAAEKDRADKAEAEVARLTEKERMVDAAISVLSLSNTEKTLAENHLPRENPYWTVAQDDVARAIRREMWQRDRADKAEQRVREAFDEAAKAVCPGCGRRALQYITEASGPNSAHNWTHDRVDGEGDPMLCAASAIHSLRARQEQKEGGR